MPSKKGLRNSSITRVRPFFDRLIDRDQTGDTWLSRLLELAPTNRDFARIIGGHLGRLRPASIDSRAYADRILKHYGFPLIKLRGCFERPVPPSVRFLRWLVEHPEEMSWPENLDGTPRTFGLITQKRRECLIGKHSLKEQQKAAQDALTAINSLGPRLSSRKWWAFEGFTEVDCCLETDKLLLFIEGKRNESVSASIDWYAKKRNQLVRNLEVAQQLAGTREFAVMVLAESAAEDLLPNTIDVSLPHLESGERDAIVKHFLGRVLWKDACRATNTSYFPVRNTRD